MAKILHLAAHSHNLGDKIASQKVRDYIHGDNKWINWNFVPIHSADFINQHDILLLGGGGLIEGMAWGRRPTGWKLPISAQTIKRVKIPIICVGLGVNEFRKVESLSKEGVENLRTLIELSTHFSVRNDGSKKRIKELTGLDVESIPDPGVFVGGESQRKEVLKYGAFNPAINSDMPSVVRGRCITTKEMCDICKEMKLVPIAHTPLDEQIGFGCKRTLLDEYNKYDYAVVMRGHGQIVGYGKNIPTISLISQNKLMGFAEENGLEDYCVDTLEKEWKSKLFNMVDRLTNDKQYLYDWYRIRNMNMDRWSECYIKFMNKVNIEIVN